MFKNLPDVPSRVAPSIYSNISIVVHLIQWNRRRILTAEIVLVTASSSVFGASFKPIICAPLLPISVCTSLLCEISFAGLVKRSSLIKNQCEMRYSPRMNGKRRQPLLRCMNGAVYQSVSLSSPFEEESHNREDWNKHTQ